MADISKIKLPNGNTYNLKDPSALKTITTAAGANIGSVGTPSVSASTSGSTTTLTFNYLKGAKGDKGDKGDAGSNGTNGTNGTNGVSCTHSWNGTTLTVTSASGTSSANLKGADGKNGTNGTNGSNGVSCTHSWNGTTLSVTSASGTSSANLKGEKGDKGDKGDTGGTGPQGPQGPTGPQGPSGAAKSFSITLNASSWSASAPYSQSVTANGVLATEYPLVPTIVSANDVTTDKARQEALACISRISATANTLTFTCFDEKPTVNLPLICAVV